MKRTHAVIWLAPLVLCGCNLAVPRLLHPGSEKYQQTRAERFDPYPLNDVGPPIAGGRPMQYEIPAPWPGRVQNDSSFEERFHQPAPPGMYKPLRANPHRQGIVYPAPAAVPLQVQPLVAPPGAAPMLPPATVAPIVPQEARNWRAAD